VTSRKDVKSDREIQPNIRPAAIGKTGFFIFFYEDKGGGREKVKKLSEWEGNIVRPC
jgi:hypothetical protein